MNRKSNQVLLAVLLVQVALVFVVHSKKSGTSIAESKAVLAEFEDIEVTSIALEESGDSDETKKILLSRAGEDWNLASHYKYPADTDKVTGLLGKLRSMKSRRSIAKEEARQKQLGVHPTNYEHKIMLTLVGGSHTIFVGRAAGRGKLAVRVDDNPEIFAIPGLSAFAFSAKPDAWVKPSYVSVEENTITQMRLRNEHGSFTLKRNEGEDKSFSVLVDDQAPTVPKDKELDTGALKRLVNTAADIRLKEPVDLKLAQVAPTATVILTTKPEEGPEQELTIDFIAEAERVIVRDQSQSFAVAVLKSEVSSLLELTTDKLFRSPPPANPQADGPPPGMMPPGMMPPGMMPQ